MSNGEVFYETKRMAETLANLAETEGIWVSSNLRTEKPKWKPSERLQKWNLFYKPIPSPLSAPGLIPDTNLGIMSDEGLITGFLIGGYKLFDVYQLISQGSYQRSLFIFHFTNTDPQNPDEKPIFQTTEYHYFDGSWAQIKPGFIISPMYEPRGFDWDIWESEETPNHYSATWGTEGILGLKIYPRVGECYYQRQEPQGRERYARLVLQDPEAPEGWGAYDREWKQLLIEQFRADLPQRFSLRRKTVKVNAITVPTMLDPEPLLGLLIDRSKIRDLLFT